jgi:hypothetical protein
MEEPYAEIFGFKPGDTKSQIYRLPIIYNSYENAYKIAGAERIKPITIKLHWANREQDLMEVRRLAMQREKEKVYKWSSRYQGSRVVQRGRALYDNTLLLVE